NFDEGLYTLGPRLGVAFYPKNQIDEMQHKCIGLDTIPSVHGGEYALQTAQEIALLQTAMQEKTWIEAMSGFCLKENQVVAAASTPGAVMLLNLRDTFKSPMMAI